MTCRCSKSTLYPDGAVRCDLNKKLAKEECSDKELGSIKLYKPTKMTKPKIIKGETNV